MSRLRGLGGLALLARCPAKGAVVTATAGHPIDAPDVLCWAASLQLLTHLPESAALLPGQRRRLHHTASAATAPLSIAAAPSPPHLLSPAVNPSCSAAAATAADAPPLFPPLPPATSPLDWTAPGPLPTRTALSALPAPVPQSLPAPCASASTSSPLSPLDFPPPPLSPSASSPFSCYPSSLEDSLLAALLSPTQLGAQLWEGVHAASGLPWWAAIPAATAAARGALLPLSLRAAAASAHVGLLHRAVGLARAAGEAVTQATAANQRQQREQQPGQQQPYGGAEAGVTPGGSREERQAGDRGPDVGRRSAGGGSWGGGSGAGAAVALGRVDLVRRLYGILRAQHGAPSFGWYLANAAVQVPLAAALSLSLRRMSDSLWPGLTSEGVAYFPDLTAQPVYLQTLSTPYGTAGAILPLALVLLYISAVDKSAGASSPGIHTALKLLILPLYCAALLQPHAVLLYWTSLAVTQLGVLHLAARLAPPLGPRGLGGRADEGFPRVAAAMAEEEGAQQRDEAAAKAGAADVPAAAGPPAEGQAQEAVAPRAVPPFSAAPLDELLMALSESYGKSGNLAAARACLEALRSRQPHQHLHAAAAARLRQLQPARVEQ